MKYSESCYISTKELEKIHTEIKNHKPGDFARTMSGVEEKSETHPHKMTLTLDVEEAHAVTNN